MMETTYYRNAKAYAAALMRLPEESLTMWGHMIQKPPRKSKPAASGRAAKPTTW